MAEPEFYFLIKHMHFSLQDATRRQDIAYESSPGFFNRRIFKVPSICSRMNWKQKPRTQQAEAPIDEALVGT